MRLYGALSELASLVIRLASGKTVKIQANEQTAAGETVVTIPDVLDGADEMVMKDTSQTLTNKTLTAPVMTNADVQSAATLQLPTAAPAINALGRIYLSGSDLRFGTSATPGAFEQVVTQTSPSNLSYKTINLAGGNGNSILNANPVNLFETDAINNVDKVVKYTALGVPVVAKISNANIADDAAIVGSKLISIPAASLSPMTSAQLAGVVTDETGSGALVFASGPSLSNVSIESLKVSRAAPASLTAGLLTPSANNEVIQRIVAAGPIDMLANPADGRGFTLINATGSAITISNETGATAVNRIITGTGAAFTFENNSTVSVIYDGGSARWRLTGGAGAGGGAVKQMSALTLAGGASLSLDTAAAQDWVISSVSGVITLAAAPFGVVAPSFEGTVVTLIGADSAKAVLIDPSPGIAKGVVMNGSVTICKGSSIQLKWNSALDRWVEMCRNDLAGI